MATRTILIAIICLLGSVPYNSLADEQSFSARVVRVIDGDTLEILRDGDSIIIRLSGIDAPEKNQAFWEEAKERVMELSDQKTVLVDPETKGKHNRLIANVILPDSRYLSYVLVSDGLAWWYRPFAPKNETLEYLESQAQLDRIGIWSTRDPQPPWVLRKAARSK